MSPKLITVVAVVLAFTAVNAIVVRQENSLYGPYEKGAPNIADWDLDGSAELAQTFVRLTPDEPGKQGGIWNTHPVLCNDWEFHMQFHIHGKDQHPHGNGLAFWYVPDISHLGPIFGSKDFYRGLGIFIHTTEDPLNPHKHRHPYISAVVNNGSQAYEHNEDGTVHQVGGCHMPVRNLNWPTKIAISYIENVLTVFLDAEGKDKWTQCFRSEDVYLPTHYFFGVTADTGVAHSDNHDIIYITALDMNLPEKQWEDRSFIRPYAENILVHPKPDEILKTLEQLQYLEEQLHKTEEKKEFKRESIEKPKEKPKEAEKPKKTKSEPSPKPVPFFHKVIYIVGTIVILYIAFSLFKKYTAQRKERMQKRLF